MFVPQHTRSLRALLLLLALSFATPAAAAVLKGGNHHPSWLQRGGGVALLLSGVAVAGALVGVYLARRRRGPSAPQG